MRMLLRWEIGLEAGNEAIRTGKIAEVNRALMERVQPESAHFGTENGSRTATSSSTSMARRGFRSSPSHCSSSWAQRSSSSR